ncbi:DUF3800 domain-containing protein [Rothia mucilaginosa]|uniref:DUF3800 domain-containing protein n=1 Tax=Rothia mucilaginosa TaxID=43675 RepID=UPI00066B3EC2|nr:DUF3800 domain-containing protein [Rothia mucilaginosa]
MADICIYCDESTHLPNDRQPYMVLGSISCPVNKTKEASKRIIEIRKKHGLSPHLEIKWTSISPSRVSFYLDVVDYFFDDDDLSFRAVIAPKANLNHNKYNQTHDEWYYKMMFYLIRNTLPGNDCSYIYLDKKDTLGGEKIKKLHEVLANSQYDFKHKKIRRLQIVESHHVNLLQLADLLIGAINYENRGLRTSPAKLQVINRIKERSGRTTLTRSTLPNEAKLNLFHWRPRS